MSRVEQTISRVGGATAREFGFRKAKCDKVDICVRCERLLETALRNALGLNDTGDYHDANSGMELANVLHGFNDRLARVDDRINKYHRELSLQMVELDVLSIAGVDEHCKREGVTDAQSHGFPTAHECHDRRLLLMEKLVAVCLPA